MTTIKFKCPNCDAKLKVPAKLAGVAGPCPKCGGTIVAPLEVQIEAANAIMSAGAVSHRKEPALSPAVAASALAPAAVSAPISPGLIHPQPKPKPAPQPQFQAPAPAVHVPPPAVHVPPPAVHVPPPAVHVPPPAVHVPPPAVHVPPPAVPVPPPMVPVPPPSPFPRPYEQVSQTAMVALHPDLQRTPPPDAASAVRLSEPVPSAAIDMLAPPLATPHDDPFGPAKDRSGRAGTPKTQPILIKKKAGAPGEAAWGNPEDLPRLDVSLAESRGHAQRHETPVHREPTIVQLPGVGEADASIFAISPPEPMERPPYRPPIPVALIPPDEEHSQPAFHSQPDYSGHGPLTEDAVFPLTEPGVYGEEEQVYELDPYSSSLEESTSEGSIAALLEQQNAPRVGSHAKSKDEILDELLGVVPPKKKKGLSASSVVMLVTTALVLIVASLGTFYVIQKAGGTSVTSEDVLGEEGLSNLSKKPESVKEENRGAEKSRLDVSQAADKTSSAEPSPLKQTEEKKPEPAVTKSAAAPQTVSATVTSAAPPQPTAIPEPTPTPSPVVAKKNYQPRPFFEAPKPGDPPLLNMHDLIDAFMRAPHAEARIPYIYHGESLRPSVIDYYKRWPDFSVDDFRVRWHSSEDAPETGGPFWVFLISRVGQEDEIEIPLIIRSENGRLKVDWETFAEFWDQHYVHFFKNGAFNPPHHFRLVIERMSEYPGPDKPGFTELKDYLCYSLNPPYGSFQAYQEYAFVKAGTSLAKQIDERVGLGETGLAVIVKVDKKDFSHGVRHWVITELSQEGWLK